MAMKIEELVKVEYQTQRVLTTKQIADAYETTHDRISHNFSENKEQFTEGVHYFKVTGAALRQFKREYRNSSSVLPFSKMANCLYLWTKQGAARHCKMLNNPNALEIWEELRTKYFEVDEPATVDPLLIRTVKGVRCYVDEEMTIHINAEDVARGLGFVKTEEKVSADGGRKTYTSIRWETVNRYLESFGFRQLSGEEDYLPENVFYRLAMKANNETARKFQATIADEILPSIRKYGYYMSPNSSLQNKQMAFDLHTAGQKFLDSTDKILPPNPDLADKLIAIAELMEPCPERNKILVHAANLLIGKNIF